MRGLHSCSHFTVNGRLLCVKERTFGIHMTISATVSFSFTAVIRVVCCTLQTNTSHGSIPHIMWSYVQWQGAIECRDTGYIEATSVRHRNVATHNKYCKRIARDPTSIYRISMGPIQEVLGQNCVLYTSAVKADVAVILAKKYYLYSHIPLPLYLCHATYNIVISIHSS